MNAAADKMQEHTRPAIQNEAIAKDKAGDGFRDTMLVGQSGPVPAHCPQLGPCWIWTGARHPLGYGITWFGKKLARAPRASIFLHTGAWPTLDVLHECDNPPCVNISHLKQGTEKENMRDAVTRGLLVNPKGEMCGKAKLTQIQVNEIRKRYAAGGITQRELASEYGVIHCTIGSIVRWAHWRE